jgi:hypothetical protein
LETLADKEAVATVTSKFGWSFDRSAWTSMRAIITDPIRVDYTALYGGEPELVPANEQIERWRQFADGFDSWQHLMSAPLIELAGNAATVHVNVVAWLRKEAAPGASLASSGGTWTFDLRRDDATNWRIQTLTADARWFDGNQAVSM